ncbi:MAG: UDP-N-acetylmuramoyl-tripeptide--D-alanyl-D-alanine ligase [Candidatus Saganbacteria bacterium]|uniref:UDP-N-acetylmuramoyl-tripeptide--D-alanyl-D-alanine ligase n=1 Tax=Candidatus Saganbacteria bacterium TaxID=2575572 RepID=A0A833L031_UNCSA|nr:MAG: UDP-N-acetylmuramoyl-tripeptide--D-alanyl-D-alanine ligase [Candidatus Saganbacteria bacterium]
MFTAAEIAKAVNGELVSGSQKIKGVSTDSRTTKKGELFIPLAGPKFDGHNHIIEAIKKGAVCVLFSNAHPDANINGCAFIKVKNTLTALQDIAKHHRNKFKLPIIGVTGSSGKTTTKDIIAAILSKEFNVLKNEENLNNEIGVPLTLLKLNKKHEAAVIEMAMQDLGEIAELADIVKPHIAVITNIGEAHLEFLKNLKNTAKAKSEIFKNLQNGDFAIINQDDEFFEHLKSGARKNGAKIITFGIIEKADITPKDLKGIKLSLPGEHNIYNALAAIAVANLFNVKKASVKSALESFVPSSKRFIVFNREDKVKIIDDTYNANPQSMKAALSVLASLKGRKIAVLGDMLELGKTAKPAHKKIGQFARKLGIDKIISVGALSKEIKADYHFPNNQDAAIKLKEIIKSGDRVLIKGSRGMHLEEIVQPLIEKQNLIVLE